MAKVGRPTVELNYDKLDALLQFKVTKAFCADYLGVSEDTIEKRLRRDHDMTFMDYAALKIQRNGLRLQQKALDMAMNGNVVMMIFCLKNIAKWSDSVEIAVEAKQAFDLAYKPKSLRDVTPTKESDDG